ncbi:PREDICTED: uncharacterized protein LOC109229840 [Nicotiana attenuata]|uniref:uncharacterized protein LOC109229840 n=1 Tax=Nicotiana attenuata TaxID=49451 RepID=UPI00090523A5|nr:PREDICTED: uncharacterized protein LOC109229840 [Nicotiana attenuata]
MIGTTETTVAQPSSANAVNFDPNHPYFLHSSDAPGMSLMNAVFDGRGFQGWRRSVLIAILAKNKLGFINGTCPAPAITSNEYQPWTRCNDMVTSWLLNSLSKDIGDSVIYSKSAKDLWTSLEHRFGRSNGAKLYHLRKELSSLVQGTSDITGYFTKLKRLWDELDSLICDVMCVCDESQREIYMNPLLSADYSSFMVGTQANLAAQENFVQRNNKQGQRNTGQFQQQSQKPWNNMQFQRSGSNMQKNGNTPQRNFVSKGKKHKFNPNLSRTHCKKIGHSVGDCYRIIGFPEDFEFTNPTGSQVQFRSNGAITREQGEDASNYSEVLNLWHIRLGHCLFHQ